MSEDALARADLRMALRFGMRMRPEQAERALAFIERLEVTAGAEPPAWPPNDILDPFWEWVPFKLALADGPYALTKLRSIRYQVGKKIGGRWFISMRRLYSDYSDA